MSQQKVSIRGAIGRAKAAATVAGLAAAALAGCSSAPWAPDPESVADACEIHVSDLGYQHGLRNRGALAPAEVDRICGDASPDPEYIARAYRAAYEAGDFVRRSNVQSDLGPEKGLDRPRHWSGPPLLERSGLRTLDERAGETGAAKVVAEAAPQAGAR